MRAAVLRGPADLVLTLMLAATYPLDSIVEAQADAEHQVKVQLRP